MKPRAEHIPGDGLPMPRRIWAILAIAFGVSLSVLDGAIANVALPSLARELRIGPADSIWIVNAYQLAIMVSLLTFSALGDRVGYRRIYIGGLALFTLASVGCALATSFTGLVLARVMQGFGASAVTSVNTTLVRTIYPQARLARGMGINATVVAFSSVAGPTIAAGILSVAPWPWLFAVNIPVGIAALLLSHRFLPGNATRLRDRFRWRDSLMNALTFGLMMLSVEGFSHGIDPRLVGAGVAAFLVVGYLFIRSQLLEVHPILPFDLLRIPIFSVSLLASVASFLAQMLALVSLPFYLQHVFGYDDVQTGLLMTAWPAVIVVVAPVAGLLAERLHAGALGAAGLLTMSVGLLLLALLPEEGVTPGAVVWRLTLCGAGFGLFQSPNNSILIASAPRARSGSASGMLASARLLGQTTGAALVALLFHLAPDGATRLALFIACGCAFGAAAVSAARLRLPLPEGLARRGGSAGTPAAR